MHLNIDCEELSNLLINARIAADSRAAGTVFGQIKLTDKNEYLVAACCNQNLHVETWCYRDGQEVVNCMIDTDRLLRLAEMGGTASVKVNEKSITFRSRHVKIARIPTGESDAFPKFPEKKVGHPLYLTKNEINNLLSAASTVSAAINLSCIQTHYQENDTFVSLVNGVGRSVTVRKVGIETPSMFISLGQLGKLKAKFQDFKIQLSDDRDTVFVSGNGYRAKFSSYSQGVAKPTKHYTEFDPVYRITINDEKSFSDQLKAIQLFSREGSPVHIEMVNGELLMSSYGGEVAEMRIDASILPSENFKECFSSINILGAILALGAGYEIQLLKHPNGKNLWMKIHKDNIHHYFMPMAPKAPAQEREIEL